MGVDYRRKSSPMNADKFIDIGAHLLSSAASF